MEERILETFPRISDDAREEKRACENRHTKSIFTPPILPAAARYVGMNLSAAPPLSLSSMRLEERMHSESVIGREKRNCRYRGKEKTDKLIVHRRGRSERGREDEKNSTKLPRSLSVSLSLLRDRLLQHAGSQESLLE